MKLIILGAPGAGKGTQADKITKHYNIPHISTGDIFRYNIKNKTELGVKVEEILSTGALVPDNLTNEIVKDRLSKQDCENGFMLDGYPRTISQVEALKNYGIFIDCAIYINVDDKSIVERMSGRLTCPKCSQTYHKLYSPPKIQGVCDNCSTELVQREDDSEQIVLKRLELFHSQTAPIINHYKNEKLLVEVNGIGKQEDIYNLILKSLKEI